MKESDIEKYLHKRVKELGGEYRRVTFMGHNGAPDDLVLLPEKHLFVECKKYGEKLRPSQIREHEVLKSSGCEVHTVYSYDDIERLLK